MSSYSNDSEINTGKLEPVIIHQPVCAKCNSSPYNSAWTSKGWERMCACRQEEKLTKNCSVCDIIWGGLCMMPISLNGKTDHTEGEFVVEKNSDGNEQTCELCPNLRYSREIGGRKAAFISRNKTCQTCTENRDELCCHGENDYFTWMDTNGKFLLLPICPGRFQELMETKCKICNQYGHDKDIHDHADDRAKLLTGRNNGKKKNKKKNDN